MSSFVHRSVIAAATAAIFAGSAGAQLLPASDCPRCRRSICRPRNIPVAGPTLQNILAQPGAREAIIPDARTPWRACRNASPKPAAATLLQLRQLRLRELIRQYPRELENDGNGQPVRRGVLVAINPDQPSLQLAARAGFRDRCRRP